MGAVISSSSRRTSSLVANVSANKADLFCDILADIIRLEYPLTMPSLWNCSDFGLYVTQQKFDVNVTLNIGQQKMSTLEKIYKPAKFVL